MPINEVGVAQASRLALFLKEQNIEHIFCSPLQRTMQTGEIIARACNVKMTVNDQFREANFGVAEGKCRKAIRSEYAQHFDVIDRIDHPNSHYMSLPGAESRMQVFNRVSDALITLVESIPL
jgi:broad specificity phosphatase PhoE